MDTNSDTTPGISAKEPVKIVAKNKVNTELMGKMQEATPTMGRQAKPVTVTQSDNLMKNQVVEHKPAIAEVKAKPELTKEEEKKQLIAEAKKGTTETAVKTDEAAKTTEENEKKDQLSPRFASLLKREKEIVAKEKAIKDQATQLQTFEKSIAEIKGNPKKALEVLQKEFAITFDDLAQAILSDGQTTPDFEVKQLKKQLEDDKLNQQKLIREQEARNIANFKVQINKHLDSNIEAYELIRANNAYETVFDVISENFSQTGHIMETEKAAKLVEDFYFEQLKKQMQAKKLTLPSKEDKQKEATLSASISDESSEESEPNRKSSRAKPKAKTKTITNQKTISIPNYSKSANKQTDKLSRIQAALSAVKIKK